MKYISTRGSKKEYSFTEAFLLSYAEDGGLFCPKEISPVSPETMEEWSHLSFFDLSVAILSLFIDDSDVKLEDLKQILKDTYGNFHQQDLLTFKKIGPVTFAEAFYGPTYHIKDFSMQFLGQFLKYLVKKDEENDKCKIYAVVVGTDADTGASLLSGTSHVDYHVNGFSIYPRDKIQYIQEREMISNVISNGHSFCMEKAGLAEVLQITRDLVVHNEQRDHINIISANSCNIVRVICEIPIIFYSYFHATSYPANASFATYVANLKSVYTIALCRDMGLPISKLVLSCNENCSFRNFLMKGEYKASKRDGSEQDETNFVHSNFERILFYMLHEDVSEYMKTVESGNSISVPLSIVNKTYDFIVVVPVTSENSSLIISLLYQSSHQYLVCPNAATSFAACLYCIEYLLSNHLKSKEVRNEDFYKSSLPDLNKAFSDVLEADGGEATVCLNTAHPGKFPYFVAEALNAPAGNIMPKDIQDLPLRNSRISVIPNDLAFVRNYIAHICFDCIKQYYH